MVGSETSIKSNQPLIEGSKKPSREKEITKLSWKFFFWLDLQFSLSKPISNLRFPSRQFPRRAKSPRAAGFQPPDSADTTGDEDWKKGFRMSWLGNLDFPSSNSNHFITCLLIFILHYSPQLPLSLFKFEQKPIFPSISFLDPNRNLRLSFKHGIWRQE